LNSTTIGVNGVKERYDLSTRKEKEKPYTRGVADEGGVIEQLKEVLNSGGP